MIITELMKNYPIASVVIISLLVTVVMTLVTKKFTNQSRMKELKDIQKACRIKIKDNRGNPEEAGKIQKEMMGCSMELMKHSFKPMLITFLPLIAFFWWIRGIFTTTVIAKSWLWYYIGVSVVSSIILRKMLKVV